MHSGRDVAEKKISSMRKLSEYGAVQDLGVSYME